MKNNSETTTIHAFNNSDTLGLYDAYDLAQRLKNKEVTTAELASDARKRALKVDNHIHAIAFNCNKSNHKIDYKSDSLFNGIPTFIKDNIEVKGFPTAYGSNTFKPRKARAHSQYTRQFLSTGLNALGKSTLPEFGLNATTEPAHTDATKNPWNLSHSAGASSGGAAALVAAGVVPIAHGNDGGGSIRIPAACCGLVGLKPSRDRHINERMVTTLPINIVSEGVVTRSVRDTAYFHWELQKKYRNKRLPKLPLLTEPSTRRLRIAYYIDSVTGFSTDSDTRNTIESIIETLRKLGHQVDEIKFPVSANFAEDFALYWGFLAFMLSKTGKITINKHFDASKLDGLSKGLANHYKSNILKTPFFLRRLNQHGLQFRSGFKEYDAYLSPVLGQTPRLIGDLHPNTEFEDLMEKLSRYASFTPMANVAGTPAISLPLGRSKSGLPIGVQFGADIGDEQTLIELAYELEQSIPWQHLYHQN